VLFAAPSAFASWGGDFNGDKRTDVMTYSGSGNLIRVAASSASGRWEQKRWADLPDGPVWKTILAGDFTGDGRTDLAAGDLGENYTVGVSNGRSFALHPWGSLPAVGSFLTPMVGDFNGDGKDDILAPGLDAGQWWVLRSTGSAFVPENWAPWPIGFWRDEVVGDFNKDGKDDFAARTTDTGDWLVGLSTGTAFTTSVWGNWAVGDTWSDLMAGDFTGDGRTDLVARNRTTGKWVVSVSTGAAFTTSPWANVPASIWVDILTGDFDGDGRTDLAGRIQSSGRWYVQRSTGSAFVLKPWGAWGPGISWNNVVSGKGNLDKRTDVIGQHSGGNWWVGISTGRRFDSTDRTERVRPIVDFSVRGLSSAGLRLGLRCSERADVTVRVELSAASARRLHMRRLLGTGVEHFLRGGADPLTVRIAPAKLRRLAGEDFGAIIRATAVDPAANFRVKTKFVTLHG
jgi:hypothetical protein